MINIGDIVKLAGPEATHAEENFWGIVTNLRESEAKADVHWMDDTQDSPQRTIEKIRDLRTIELGDNNVSR
jgi:hypothetical protein